MIILNNYLNENYAKKKIQTFQIINKIKKINKLT